MSKEITHIKLWKPLLFLIFPIFWVCVFFISLYIFLFFQETLIHTIQPFFFWILFGSVLIFWLICIFLSVIKYRLSITYITNIRVFTMKKTFFQKIKTQEMPLKNIKSVQSKIEWFFGNTFGFWSIEFSGENDKKLYVKGVKNPIEATRKINQIIQSTPK